MRNGVRTFRPDLRRAARTGIPEVILSEGKTPGAVVGLVREFLASDGRAIVSRVTPARAVAIKREFAANGTVVEYNPHARLCIVRGRGYRAGPRRGTVAILAAGTSDVPVAEEARAVAEAVGCRVVCAYDVGVAGLHRTTAALRRMKREGVDAYIVVAGREGALPTVVAGLVDAPVIGLPVSTGYGEGGRGRAALYSMLQSCAPLAVVNIDAGFVAGAVAAQIAHRRNANG